MSGGRRHARVSALAKINLGLSVLGRRADGYHELRTVFQTVSLADILDLEFSPGPETRIAVSSDVPIPGTNLIERAACLTLDAMRVTGAAEFRVSKKIPMGAGLGGGSSDAAAVLLALPALAGGALPLQRLIEIAGELGSDVPFFLLGGTAAALGRGTEVYPLPDPAPATAALLVAPGIHVSTPEAYRALNRPALTSPAPQNMISTFQSSVWALGRQPAGTVEANLSRNDFEPVVFSHHPQLESLKQRLQALGARPAMLSGSGSALFGLFAGKEEARRAAAAFTAERAYPVSLVSRAQYRALWWRGLQSHIAGKVWPPQSRYA